MNPTTARPPAQAAGTDPLSPQARPTLLQRLRRGTRGDVLIMAGGSVLGQGLVIVLSPVLTRLYGPADFGILAVFLSWLSLSLVLASLRFEMAIPLPESEEDAVNILAVSLAALVVVVSLCLVAVLCLGPQLVHWTKTPALGRYLFLLPLGLLGGGAYQAFSYWTTRHKQFSVLSGTKAAQGMGQAVIQVVGGLLHLGPVCLIAGFVASQCIGIGSLVKRAALPLGAVSLRRMGAVAREYRHFPYFTVWANLINVAGQQVPPLLFAHFFAVSIAGQFALTVRILGLPIALVGVAVQQVLYPSLARLKNEPSQAAALMEKTATSLFVLSFCLFSFVLLRGPWLFGRVFGPQWERAGHYAQLLAPWFVVSLVSATLSCFALICGRQKQALLMTLYEAGLRLGGIAIGVHAGSAELSIRLYSFASVIITLIYLEWVLRLAGTNCALWLGKIKAIPITGFAVVALLWLVGRALGPTHTLLSASLDLLVLIGLAAYFVRKGVSSLSSLRPSGAVPMTEGAR